MNKQPKSTTKVLVEDLIKNSTYCEDSLCKIRWSNIGTVELDKTTGAVKSKVKPEKVVTEK